MSAQAITLRNNVTTSVNGKQPMIFAHGFGCDQNMWRFVAPYFADDYQVVLFDYVGSGKSDISKYDVKRYSRLEGYAEDILDICEALELTDAILVGHSVSSTIGLLASLKWPSLFSRHIMVCPSPSFLNYLPDYLGGFEKPDLEELLNLMDKNYIGWANYLAPLVMGMESTELLTGELSGSFCSTDPVIAKAFAKATFMSDYRDQYAQIKHPSLIIQNTHDALAATTVGQYLHRIMADNTITTLDAHGHCPHMTHPKLVIDEIGRFLNNEIAA
jgi:sigma-B regulation protein RsbQ